MLPSEILFFVLKNWKVPPKKLSNRAHRQSGTGMFWLLIFEL